MSQETNGRTRRRRASTGLDANLCVLLFVLDDRVRNAQTALLRAFGHRVIPCTNFDELLGEFPAGVDCLSVDLRGLQMSPEACMREIRERGIEVPVILLGNTAPGTGRRRPESASLSDDGLCFLLWQPVDIELYLKILHSFAEPD